MLTISGLFTLLTTYLIQIYVGNQSGLLEVILQCGFVKLIMLELFFYGNEY
jgi:hypothetical protein